MIVEANDQRRGEYNPEVEVAAAVAALDRLPELAADPANLAKVGAAFRLVNAWLFLKFQKVQVKQRTLSKVAFGMMTFGDAPSPVPLYAGPTGRRALAGNTAAMVAASPEGGVPLPDRFGSGREGNSLGNVNRGDRQCTFVDEINGLSLVRGLFPQTITFNGDAVLDLVEPGRYTKRGNRADRQRLVV